MPIHGCDALVDALFEQLRRHHLLDRQHHALLAPDADRGAAVLHRLQGVFGLEVAAIGGEDGVGEIVACSYRRLRITYTRLATIIASGPCLGLRLSSARSRRASRKLKHSVYYHCVRMCGLIGGKTGSGALRISDAAYGLSRYYGGRDGRGESENGEFWFVAAGAAAVNELHQAAWSCALRSWEGT